MANNISLFIYSFGSVLFNSECEGVILPGIDGSFEICFDHIPVCLKLASGKIKIINTDKEFDINDNSVAIFQENLLTVFLS